MQLACYYCRSKRIRCNGVRPICSACTKVGAHCEWPTGRRRKRTKREMKAARQVAAESERQHTAHNYHAECNPADTSTGLLPRATTEKGTIVWTPNDSIPWPGNSAYEGTRAPLPPNNPIPTDPFAGFLLENSPGTDLRLLDRLNQTAYLSGDGSVDGPLELFYYRISGSTAINPGVHRISLKLQRREVELNIPQPGNDVLPADSLYSKQQLFIAPYDLFDSAGLPHRHVWDPHLDNFLLHMSSHFPSVSRKRMSERYDSGTMSAFLANCICALGARFGQGSEAGRLAACAPFIAKAEQLVVPLLHLPAHDVCTGLLFLAWSSYGQSSDAGLWQYAGMSIRMAVDLGIQENSDIYESPQHVVRTRLLFWSLFITDTVLAFSTGRPTTIAEETIAIPLPRDEDFFPDPAHDAPSHLTFKADDPVQPVPFVVLVRLMIITARIANVLNGRRGRARTLIEADIPGKSQLPDLQKRLIDFYASLPESMQWSAYNFKTHFARGHGSTFLAIHLWTHAVLALVYHPELLQSPSGMDTPFNSSISRNIQLASASSRQISECLVFADLMSHTSYTASPFVVQPLYIAAMALVHEMRAMTANGTATPGEVFLASLSKQNLSALIRAIGRTEEYWAGAAYVATMLEKRKKRCWISSQQDPACLDLIRRLCREHTSPCRIGAYSDGSKQIEIIQQTSHHRQRHRFGTAWCAGNTSKVRR